MLMFMFMFMFILIDQVYVTSLTQPRRPDILSMVGDDQRVDESVQSCNIGDM